MRLLLPFFCLLLCMCFSIVHAQTTFYSTGTNSSPTTLSNWNTARNGTGSAPSDFTTANQVFIVQDGHTISRTTGGWTISGSGSYLKVEPGGTYNSTSSTGATLTLQLEGSAAKPAIWNQTSGYANVTFQGWNLYSFLILNSPANFRMDRTYAGSVLIRGNFASTLTTVSNGLNIGGDLILSTNATFIGASTSNVTHTIGGSFIIRGGTYQQASSTYSPTFNIGGSLAYVSGSLGNGAGSAMGTYNIGTANLTDTLALNGNTLNANINTAANATILIKDNCTLNGGTFNSGSNSKLYWGNAILSGTSNVVFSANTEVHSTNTSGLKNGSTGNLAHSGTTSTTGTIDLVYEAGASTSAGLAGLTNISIADLIVKGSNTQLNLDADIVVHDSLAIEAGASISFSGVKLELAGPVKIIGMLSANSSGALHLTGSGSISGLVLPATLEELKLDRTGFTLNSGSFTCTGNYALINGAHRLETGTLTLNGPSDLLSQLEFSAAASLQIGGTGQINGALTTDTVYNLTLNRPSIALAHQGSLYIAGDYVNTNGLHDIRNKAVTIAGAINVGASSLLHDSLTLLNIIGAGTITALPVSRLGSLNFDRAGAIWTLTSDLKVDNAFTIAAGTINASGKHLQLFGAITQSTGNLTTDSLTSITIGGTGAITGFSGYSKVNNLALKRNVTYTKDGSLTVYGTLSNTVGSIVFNNGDFTLYGPVATLNNTWAVTNANSTLHFLGAGSISQNVRIIKIKSLTMDRVGQTVQLIPNPNVVTINGGVVKLLNGIVSFSNYELGLESVDFIATNGYLRCGSFGSIKFSNWKSQTGLVYLPTRINNVTIGNNSFTYKLGGVWQATALFVNGSPTIHLVDTCAFTGVAAAFVLNDQSKLIADSTASLYLTGTNGLTTTNVFDNITKINNLSYTRNTVMPIRSNLKVRGSFNTNNATLRLDSCTLALHGNITGNGTINASNGTLHVLGAGSIAGTTKLGTIKNFKFQRAGTTWFLANTTTCTGSFDLLAGKVGVGTNALTLSGNINLLDTLTTTSASNLYINGSGSFAGMLHNTAIQDFTLNRSGITVTQSRNISIGGSYSLLAGTHTLSDRAVTFSGPVTLSGGNFNTNSLTSLTFSGSGLVSPLPVSILNNLTINRADTIKLSTSSLTVDGTFTAGTGAGPLNVIGKNLELKGPCSGVINLATNNASNLTVSGSGSFQSVSGVSQLGSLIITRPAISFTVGSDLNIANGASIVSSTTFDFSGRTITLNGNADLAGPLKSNTASSLVLAGSGSLNLADLDTLNNLTLTRTSNALVLAKDLLVNGTLTVGTGANLDFSNYAIKLYGPVTNTGTMTPNASSSIYIEGSGAISGLSIPGALNNFTFNRAITLTLSSDLSVAGSFITGASSTLGFASRTLTLNGPIQSNGAFNSNSSSTLLIGGSGAINSGLAISTLSSLSLNRTAVPYLLGANLTVSNALNVANGSILNSSGRTLTLNGNIDLSGSLITDKTSVITIGGTGTFNYANSIDTVGSITLSRSGLVYNLTRDLFTNAILTIQSGNTLKVNSAGLIINGQLANAGTLSLDSTSNLTITANAGTITGLPAIARINKLYLAKSGYTFQPASTFTAYGSFTILSGTCALSGKTAEFRGPILVTAAVTSDANTNLKIVGSGDINGFSGVGMLNNFYLDRPGATFLLTASVQIKGDFYLGAGSVYNINTGSLNVFARITTYGDFMTSETSSFNLEGSGAIIGDKIYRFSKLKNFSHKRTSLTFTQLVDITFYGKVYIGASCPFQCTDIATTFYDDFVSNSGITLNANSSIHILGSGLQAGFPNFTLINNFTNTRVGYIAATNNPFTVGGKFKIGAGAGINLNSKTATFKGDVELEDGATLTTNSSTLVVFAGSGTFKGKLPVSSLHTLRLNRPGLVLPVKQSLTIANTLELDGGTVLQFNGTTLTLNGPIDNEGDLNTDSLGSLVIAGSGTISGSLSTDTINHLTLSRANMYLYQSVPIMMYGNLSLSNGAQYAIGANSLTLYGNATTTGTSKLVTTSESDLILKGAGSLANFGTISELDQFVLDRSGLNTVTLNADLLVYGNLSLSALNQIDLSGKKLELRGNTSLAGKLLTNSTSSFYLTGSGAFTGAIEATELATLVINRAGITVNQTNDLIVNSQFLLNAATYDVRAKSLSLKGNIDIAGTLHTDSLTNLYITGSGYISGLPDFSILHDFKYDRANTGFTQRNDLKIKGAFYIGSGSSFNFYNRAITLTGDVSLWGDLNSNTNSAFTITGSGKLEGALSADELMTLKVSRPNDTLKLNSNLYITGGIETESATTLYFPNQTLNLGGAVNLNGPVRGNNSSVLFVNAGVPISGIWNLDTLGSLVLNSTSIQVGLSNRLFVNNELKIVAGSSLDVKAKSLYIQGELNNYGTIYTNKLTSIYLTGVGVVNNFPPIDSINNLTLNRSGFNFTPAQATLVVGGTFNLGSNTELTLYNKTAAFNGGYAQMGSVHTDATTFITFNGSGSVTGFSASQLGGLKINRSAATITLLQDLVIEDSLQMQAGVIQTGSNKITLGPSATISGETNASRVIGTLVAQSRTLGNNGNSFSGIGFIMAAGLDDVGNVEVTRTSGTGSASAYSGSTSIATNYAVVISGSQPVNGRVISISWLSADANGNDFANGYADCWTRSTASDPWTLLLNDAQILTSGDWRSVSGSAFHFSDFTITDQTNLLPVSIASFGGTRAEKVVKLTWVTLQETDNKGFVISKSTDGLSYNALGFVKGSGTITEKQQYVFHDFELQPAYYKLVQVDANGDTVAYQPIYVEGYAQDQQPHAAIDLSQNQLRIAPVNLASNAVLTDAGGKEITSFPIRVGQSLYTLPVLPQGIYYLHLTGLKESKSLKLLAY